MDLDPNLENWFNQSVTLGQGKSSPLSFLLHSYQYFNDLSGVSLETFEEKLRLFLAQKEIPVLYERRRFRRRGCKKLYLTGLEAVLVKPRSFSVISYAPLCSSLQYTPSCSEIQYSPPLLQTYSRIPIIESKEAPKAEDYIEECAETSPKISSLQNNLVVPNSPLAHVSSQSSSSFQSDPQSCQKSSPREGYYFGFDTESNQSSPQSCQKSSPRKEYDFGFDTESNQSSPQSCQKSSPRKEYDFGFDTESNVEGSSDGCDIDLCDESRASSICLDLDQIWRNYCYILPTDSIINPFEVQSESQTFALSETSENDPNSFPIESYFFKSEERKFEKPVLTAKPFDFQKAEKENEKFFCNLIFSRHFNKIKNLTPANMPCEQKSFEEFLDIVLPGTTNKKIQNIIQSAKCFRNSFELKLKAFLCGSFPPILTGNVACIAIDYLEIGVFIPQFSVVKPWTNSLEFSCNTCHVFSPYAPLHGRSSVKGTGQFQGMRQLYEHAISKHHQFVLEYLSQNRESDVFLPKQQEKVVSDYFAVEKKGTRVSCHFIWEKKIVDCFKDNKTIRTRQLKTYFKEDKPWKKCAKNDGHKNCWNFEFWKGMHPKMVDDFSKHDSSRCVFVPGTSSILIGGKHLKIEGGIKSLDPMCTGVAVSIGEHPYTCENCESQRAELNRVMKSRKSSKLKTNESRVGKPGFKTCYATKEEEAQRVRELEDQNRILKSEIKFERVQREKKSWEQKIIQSCEDDNIKKLIVDLVSLFQQESRGNCIQMEILKNIVGKLKSKNNHKFNYIIKDIAVLYKNKLGVTSYEDLKDLFCLPGKTCVDEHAKENKLYIGLNENVFEKGVEFYNGGPVVESSDEARTLRFISPIVGKGNEVELIGQCWNSNIVEWEKSRVFLKDIISDTSFVDEFSALKNYIDGVISSDKLAKDCCVHNFVAGSGVMSKPLVFLYWPTPNSGYCAPHLLRVWDEIRRLCFLDSNGDLRKLPINLLGHSTDSAGFQLAAAATLMTPHDKLLEVEVKYLTLGCGESKFAAPYLGPLPSIGYLDFDHNLRLFLKCLKYVTLDMDIFPSADNTDSNLFPSCKSGSHIVTINHLKELKQISDDKGIACDFSNNDLLFARYLDQNSDAALKVFTSSVADLLEAEVPGSAGTVLYIRAVVALYDPFINPEADPIKMQEKISTGITIFRIWRRILDLKKKRLYAIRGAAKNPSCRGKFVTYGCYKTAEIHFSAATCHMLAIFCHFRHLGPSALSPFKCGTKCTERIISELQGKTNHLQSLDSQPTLSDIASRISKVQSNQTSEDKILAQGGTKHSSTNRKRLAHKLKKVENSTYKFPETFEQFRANQRKAFKKGVDEGIKLFKKYCPEGVKFVFEHEGFDFLTSFNNNVPLKNQFDGELDEGYAIDKLKNLSPTDLLTMKAEKKERKITDYMNPEDDEDKKRAEKDEQSWYKQDGPECDEVVLKTEELQHELLSNDESDLAVDDENENEESKIDLKQRWYLTRKVRGEMTKIHLRQALKFLIPREYVSRERSKRHIASKFLPDRKEIESNHNILLFRYVIAKISNEVVVCKVGSLNSNGKSLLSASSDDENVTCRLLPLEKVLGEEHEYCMPDKIVVSDWLKVSNILGEVNMVDTEDQTVVVVDEKSKEFIRKARQTFMSEIDRKIAQKISKGLLPLEFKEVEDVLEKKLDPKTHLFIYRVKFKDQNEGKEVWLNSSCFDRPFQYSKRDGLKSSGTLFAHEEPLELEKNNDVPSFFQKKSSKRTSKSSPKNEGNSAASNDMKGKKSRKKKSDPTKTSKPGVPISSNSVKSLLKAGSKRESNVSLKSVNKRLKISQKSIDSLHRFGFSTTESSPPTPLCSGSTKRSPSVNNQEVFLSDDSSNEEILAGCDKLRVDDYFDWSDDDDKRISNGDWMTGNIMDRAGMLLKKQFPSIRGLQTSLFGSGPSKFQSRLKDFKEDRLQMHNDGEHHWVLSRSLGEKIKLYDSSKDEPTENLKEQLRKCYGSCVGKKGKLEVKYESVCRQDGAKDCGIFTIAFATDIAFGNDPANIFYNQTLFRVHLKNCFKSEKMAPFPRLLSSDCEKTLSKTIFI